MTLSLMDSADRLGSRYQSACPTEEPAPRHSVRRSLERWPASATARVKMAASVGVESAENRTATAATTRNWTPSMANAEIKVPSTGWKETSVTTSSTERVAAMAARLS